ncbi:alpha/beta hydrolase [Terriglobus saanensis]|uniref:Phospholipase/Carboxylesterase n=1 Tax=Terriglobus saanensis (strain ATCC BAA-1853 / DSM 23119 / SP1PR4) TaxID=401053 RepID=E8UWX7_TERSS|nr:dienelactone hydrolase family protein [Terriglobus saanensis]ADV81864.1 phospholipase/Carboxylesterase [Terriglobus saanensis SP1PR4]
MSPQNPHGTQPVVAAGTSLADAAGVLILLHGRGASAEDILGLGQEIVPAGWAMLAPSAAGHTWYPYSFLAPREQNEPYLSSALAKIQSTLDMALQADIPAEKIAIAGFSQGACLATEFVGRNPRKYGALLAFTGGLIGPPDAPLTLAGDLAGTPVLLSSGDPDPHVPWARVQESADLLQKIGGHVTLRRYPGRPHTIGPEEVRMAREMLAAL